jgi:hypothetical protein
MGVCHQNKLQTSKKSILSCLVQPGANVVDMVAQSNSSCTHLTKTDAAVLQGGSNDVYHNN